MPVYVDNFNARFGRMRMCHMIADTTDELLSMVSKIGVQRKWIQYPGTANEHFDICLSKKAKAVEFGAIEIDMRDYARKVEERRKYFVYKAATGTRKRGTIAQISKFLDQAPEFIRLHINKEVSLNGWQIKSDPSDF